MVDPEIPKDDRLEITPKTSVTPEIGETVAAVRLLLAGDTIEDEADTKIIEGALAFLENPTEDPEDTRGHLDGIGMLLAINYGEIADQPPELSDVNRRLYILISQQRIKLIETELENGMPDKEKVDALYTAAFNCTGVLVKYYNYEVLRNRVDELHGQIEIMAAKD
jgi:hypothetical protein